mmetsp:Transcript_74112/g.209282  ORF Transcript_74112/g.209282 Transcript_74112/m.209282 type:complete len:200 (-) Transcript_74112:586-1185(-)
MPRPCSVSAALAMRPEWKAFLTCSFVHLRSASFSSVSRACTADVSPETTACTGEFTAASQRPGRSFFSTAWSSCSDHPATESIAPSPARASVAFALVATISVADFRLKSPPVTAAAYSPRECPATATGETPTAESTCMSAYSTAKRLGCSTDGRENSATAPSPVAEEKRTGLRSKPSSSGAPKSSQHRSTASRKNGTSS